MVGVIWVLMVSCLILFIESKQCNNQKMRCVCSNSFIQRLEVEIGLGHLLEKADCNLIKPFDCDDFYNHGYRQNRVYKIYPDGKTGFDVYCDMKTDGGGWTEMTKRGSYRLRVDLEDFNGIHKYASYSNFAVGNESTGYKLTVGGSSGTANDSLKYHNGQKFTTKDKDQDTSGSNCAIVYKGAWWYKNCYHSNLNGLYMKNAKNNEALKWNNFHISGRSLRTSEMKIKRKH